MNSMLLHGMTMKCVRDSKDFDLKGQEMLVEKSVQNGTYKKLGKEVGIVAAVNSDLKVNVSVYLSEREKFTSEFNAWSKKTAQSTLEMCRVVFEAKKELESQDFLKFCNAIGRKGEDATVRKYLKIGEKYDKFYQYANLLPNSWTSIYEIAQLPSEMFEALVTTENSMANMTGAQIKELMGKGTEDKSKAAASTTAVTSKAQTADQSSETTSDASEDDEGASSSSDATEAATASSDASEAESNVSIADETEVSADQTDDSSSIGSDREFAKQATSTMLEQAVSAAASTTVEVEVEEAFEPYEITIRFNSKPSDVAVAALVESLVTIKSKHRLDFDFVMQKAFVV